ncbi:MAG: 2Fe-2S iron-sulfur cluster-binding protein, partial [bacterium]
MVSVKINTPEGPVDFQGESGAMLDDIILSAGVLFDRPCGGRGKCGKCRVKASGELSPLSDVEKEKLSPADIKAGVRLACQMRVVGDSEVWFESEVVFSDKTFSLGYDLAGIKGDLGFAVDLGTTTVAVFIVRLADGKVYAGNATLNLQKNYGAEVMSRLDKVTQYVPGPNFHENPTSRAVHVLNLVFEDDGVE